MQGFVRRLTSPLLAVVLGATVLAGCSGGADDGAAGAGGSSPSADASASAAEESATGSPSAAETTATASATPYLPVPAGVELTAQGSELAVGDTAVVAWQPKRDLTGALEVTVQRLERTTFKESFVGWKLDQQTRTTNPYFVRATVRNVGDSDLGGLRVPLYIVDGRNTLVEYSRFASTFKPCPSEDFPKKFAPGKSREVCLVYLAPEKGELTAVSFRPTQEFNPITWTGGLKPVAKPGAGGKGGSGGGKGGGKGGSGGGTSGSGGG